MTTIPLMNRRSRSAGQAAQDQRNGYPEQVLPRVWRWADVHGSDCCGTALATSDGTVLIDPPALAAEAQSEIERAAGPVRHVVLTSARHVALAAPYRAEGAIVWVPVSPAAGLPSADSAESVASGQKATTAAPEGSHRIFAPGDPLPGGLIACQLPEDAASDGEVALLWPQAADGLLITGDVLPVVGQTPVYHEGEAPPVAAYLNAIKALLAADPGTLAPAHQAPMARQVAFATGSAASIGTPYHARRAAPVDGPRFLVPKAARVLDDTLVAPVVVRRPWIADRPVGSRPDATDTPEQADQASLPWIADPFACARCGKPNQPMAQTCGGPMIARLCPDCRALRRNELPVVRVMVCAGGCCTREGARAVLSAARQSVTAHGMAERVDVVPVSCLGECSLGPFVRVSTAQGQEPEPAASFRERSIGRARRYAADEGEIIDDESELVLSRFAALVQPTEVARLIDDLPQALPNSPLKNKERAI